MNPHSRWTREHVRILMVWQQRGHTRTSLSQLFQTKPTLWARVIVVYEQLQALPRRTRRALQRQLAQSLAGVAFLLTLGQGHALAATITVGGGCTLVDAITAANTDMTAGGCSPGSGADTIVLPMGSTQTLTTAIGPNGLPVVSTPITIEGNGSTITRASGAPSFRLLEVNNTGDLKVQETTLSGGYYAFSGGAVYNHGTFALIDSTISGNRSNIVGGGLDNNGTGTIFNSTISNNRASNGLAGGVYNRSNGVLTIISSTIAENVAPNAGGGIRNGGLLIVVDSTIAGNRASTTMTFSSSGGGISNRDTGTAVLFNSTLSGNTSFVGGGLSNSGIATLFNTTISGNGVFKPNFTVDDPAQGGGIFNSGSLTVSHSTITDNTAVASIGPVQSSGGGIGNRGALVLTRTLISGNTAPTVPEVDNRPGGGVNVNDFNLFGLNGTAGVSGFTPGATDIIPSVALSAILNTALAANGGPTLTHALVSGSPAVDTVLNNCPPPETDQRGFTRPADGDGNSSALCDIGAFELGAEPPPPPVCGNGTVEVGEQCDDGNIINGDGCSATCMIEPPPPGDPHDLAVTDLVAPRAVTLTATRPLQTRIIRVQLQNRSPHVETIPDQATLDNLLEVTVESLGDCPAPTLVQSSSVRFPFMLKSKQKLTLRYTAVFDCANDPAQSTKTNPGHEDFRFTAMVDHAALDGEPETHPADDVCPRCVPPPFELDPNPDGTIQDKGCGRRKPDGTFGAEVLTDVIDKR